MLSERYLANVISYRRLYAGAPLWSAVRAARLDGFPACLRQLLLS